MAAKPEPAAKPPARRGKRKVAPQLTPAKRRVFLDMIRQGKNRQEAAVAVGETGSRLRTMLREGSSTYDASLAVEYEQAVEEGRQAIVDMLAAEGLRRQLGKDPSLMSDRGLHNERIFRDPDYRAAHRQAPTVSVTTEMEVTHVHIEGAADGLRAKLAPVIDLRAAGDAETRDR